jgi:lantibiotic modifying enzyme
MNADVPYFCAWVGGRPSASRSDPACVVASGGWKAAANRVNGLSLKDKERQIWITRLSFVRFNRGLPKSTWRRKRATRPVIAHAVRAIGDKLCELAIVKNERANWLFPMLDDTMHLVPAICGLDLYDGLSGVALFLGALHVQTGAKRYRRMAEAAVAEAFEIFRRIAQEGVSTGGFEGAGGFAYTLALLGTWLDRPDWRAKAALVVRREAGNAARNGASDLISGQAGFLMCGIAVAKTTHCASILDCVRPCADNLVALTADRLPVGIDAGLAHGKAGIALALARWAETTGSKDIRKRAMKLLARDLASILRTDRKPAETSENVLDGRDMIAWCRGGVGTALAVLRSGFDAEAACEAVVGATAARLSGNPDDDCLCLCHGLFGVLEFLDEAAGRDIKGARAIAKSVREEAVSRILAGEFCSDSAHRLDAPGLMKGMAGTGYALLRLLEPRTVPSVLTLESGWR